MWRENDQRRGNRKTEKANRPGEREAREEEEAARRKNALKKVEQGGMTLFLGLFLYCQPFPSGEPRYGAVRPIASETFSAFCLKYSVLPFR